MCAGDDFHDEKVQLLYKLLDNAILNSVLNPGDFLKIAATEIAKCLNVECTEIRLLDKQDPDRLVGEGIYVYGKSDQETKKALGGLYHGVNSGLFGKVYKEGRPYIYCHKIDKPLIDHPEINAKLLGDYLYFLPSKCINSMIIIPIIFHNGGRHAMKLGCLRVINRLNADGMLVEDCFAESDVQFLASITERVALGAMHAKDDEELRETLKIQKCLQDIASSVDDLEDVLSKIQTFLKDYTKSIVSSIWIYDRENRKFVLRNLSGIKSENVPKSILDQDDCLIGGLLNRNEPVYWKNVSKSVKYKWSAIVPELGSPALLAVPLINREGSFFGAICLHPPVNSSILDSHLKVISNFAYQATSAIEHAILKKRENQIATLINGLDTSGKLSSTQFFDNIVNVVMASMDSMACSLFWVDFQNRFLILKATTDKNLLDKIDKCIYTLDESITSHVAKYGHPIISQNVFEDDRMSRKFMEYVGTQHRSYIGVPIKDTNNKVVGVIRCINKVTSPTTPTHFFTMEDKYLLVFIASIISGFIENAELMEQIRIVNRERKEFTHQLTHEIDGPIHKILERAEFLQIAMQKDNAPQKLQDYVQGILDRCELLKMLTDGPRLIEERPQSYQIKSTNLLMDVVRKCINNLHGFAIEKKINIIDSNFDKAPYYDLDCRVFTWVVYELIQNAIKYSFANRDIKIEFISDEDGSRIDIINAGIGVPEGWEKKIFRRFMRAPNAFDQSIHGTGFGLNACQILMWNLRGDIELRRSNNPTVFSIILPKKQMGEYI